MTRSTQFLIFFAIFALVGIGAGCASSASNAQLQTLPQDLVSDPAERITLLEHGDVRAWESEHGVTLEEVYALDGWREVRRGDAVVNKTRRVAFVGVAREGATLGELELTEGACYMVSSDTFRHHLGDGQFRTSVDVRVDASSAVEVDCSGLPSRSNIALDDGSNRFDRSQARNAASCEVAYRCTSLKESTHRPKIDVVE